MNQRTLTSPNFDELKRKARTMSDYALVWSAKDASEAMDMAEQLDRAGYFVSKSAGYYADEISVYLEELKRRRGA